MMTALFSLLTVIFLCIKSRFRLKKNRIKYIFLTVFATLFFLLGLAQTQYYNFIKKDFQSKIHSKYNELSVVIKETLPKKRYLIVDVLSINDARTYATILIYPRDTIEKFQVGEVLLVKSKTIYPISTALNPNQFDAKFYFFHQKIFARCYADAILKTGKKDYFLLRYRYFVRQKIKNIFQNTHFNTDVKNLFYALILGDKSGISKTQMNDYARAGVVHVLAISGLHVGILLWFFQMIFSFLRLFKHGRTLQYISVAISLWGYAFLVGGSPSVVRAVTLFSIFLVGRFLGVQRQFLKQLAIAALFVLMIDPHQIFQLGFQMSYAAVFAIVSLQPSLAKLWQPKYKIINYFWQLATVSIAAQLGVLPLSLYYFHQIPLLFLLSNLTILPLITLWVVSGMGLLLFSFIGISLDFFSPFYNTLVKLMQQWTHWIARQDFFVLTDIYLNIWDFFLLVLLIGFSAVAFIYKRRVYVFIAITIGILMTLFSFACFYDRSKTEEFIVFHHWKHTLIGLKKKQKMTFYTNDHKATEPIYKPYLLSQMPCQTILKKLDTVYHFSDKQLIIADKNTHLLQGVIAPLILLTQNANVNLEQIVIALKPSILIIDGTNKYYKVSHWKQILDNYQIPYHLTAEKGAFILKTASFLF